MKTPISPSLMRPLQVVLVVGAFTTSALPARAQLGPELYGVTHYYGSLNLTTARGSGLGAASATMRGIDSPNPAAAAYNDGVDASLRFGRTRFDGGTRFDSNLGAVSIPLGKKDGLKIEYTTVRSPERSSFATAVFPGSTQRFREENLGLFYGRQITERLALGVAAAPVLSTHHRLNNTVAPDIDIRFDSKPITNKLKRLGGRIGADYTFAPWGRASLYYDNYWERVTMTVPAALAPAGLTTQQADFHDVGLTSGLELTPLPHLTLLAQRQRISVTGGSFRTIVHNTSLGAEYEVARGIALRVGRNSGNSTYGLGVSRGRLDLQVARINNLAIRQLKPLFGDGNRFTVAELGYRF
jgi:hypothetical protein